tara:strand:- start:166 stop:456 length:291 start_codon:yes stop_codon:yes gene_type:complete
MKISKEQWREMNGLADLDQEDLRGLARREANLVDHPVHYNQGKYEVIDVIEDWNLNFHCSNAIKYISRHAHKGDAKRDIEKAIWYLQRYLEQLNNE